LIVGGIVDYRSAPPRWNSCAPVTLLTDRARENVMDDPNPLKPGHIDGQNPAERMPHATAEVQSQLPHGSSDGMPAFLFRAGDMAAVSQDSSGANVPESGEGPWVMDKYFTLGVSHVGLLEINPEPVIRGINARGYYMWRVIRGGEGQSQ
jgi:hypothetical protein